MTVGAAIHNESIRRHRPLIVINDTGVAASIQIDDRPAGSVIGKQTLAIAEGRHTVKVFGPVEEQHVMEVTSRYWERWSLTPVWIVNVGGEAIILDMQVYYAANPREPDIRYCIEQRRSNYGKMICSGL